MKKRPGESISMPSLEALLGAESGVTTEEIEIRKILPFKGHPFRVRDDEKMMELAESIRQNGVLTPVLVRPFPQGGYEMISGHRRMRAAEMAGLTTIPAVIRDLSDDEATIMMVDSNIQREELLPSKKAFAYRMKMEAMRHQGKQKDETSRRDVDKLNTAEVIGEAGGESGRQVQRYIRLTYLIPDLLRMVDEQKITITAGVEISYLQESMQKWVLEYISLNQALNTAQLASLRELRDKCDPDFSQLDFNQYLNDLLPRVNRRKKITLDEKKLSKYFPLDYTQEQMESVVYSLLDEWVRKNKPEDVKN